MRLVSAAAFILAFTVAGADVIGQAPAGQGGTPAQGQGRAAGAAGGGRGGGQGRGGQGRGRGQQGPPPAATPRWPDGKPILGSIPGKPVDGWGAGVTTLPQGMLDQVPFQPWARAAYDIRQIDQFEPHTRCKASGVSRQFSTPYGTEFVEVPDLKRMYIIDNGGPNSYRIIYLDGRQFPAKIPPTNYGYSIGHWEGDTLVVETRGLNEKFWMDTRGTPHTQQLKFTERFTRLNMETMEYQAIIDDPGAYTRPWTTQKFQLRRRAGEEPFEYICQQYNQGPELMVGTQESIDNSKFYVP
ncbi:MAG TPA: hypothetical protein VL173_11235 [Vicinamibacterales bacterium]|nr:hypothetical protein [Vicinamibacterales bacterium]